MTCYGESFTGGLWNMLPNKIGTGSWLNLLWLPVHLNSNTTRSHLWRKMAPAKVSLNSRPDLHIGMDNLFFINMQFFQQWNQTIVDSLWFATSVSDANANRKNSLKIWCEGKEVPCCILRGMVKNPPLLRGAGNNGRPWVHAVMCDNIHSDICMIILASTL